MGLGLFADHVALLTLFLDRRPEIVDRINSTLLNVRDKPTSRSRDRRHFERLLDACFFDLPGLPADACRLKGRLAAARLADGFQIVATDDFCHELDPLELVPRAYRYWESARWPGRSGRERYAQTVYGVFLLRQLEDLSLRIWDEDGRAPAERLDELQRLLDRLNEGSASHTLIRDVRWLVQTAQGPLTRHLEPYFRIASHISRSLNDAQRLEIHAAGAKLAGGHLRSQLRYRTWNVQRPIDDPEIAAFTRDSNSMDAALLVGDLVFLLDAYKVACSGPDAERRLELADAIVQGMSADPELFLTRLDLLEACTMIENLFIEADADGIVRRTRLGSTHRELIARYRELLGDLAASLREDADHFDPSRRPYSPVGIAYGFCSDLLSNMAWSTLFAQPTLGLTFEDTFVSRGRLDDKLARARGWQALPVRDGEREHFYHSPEWASEMFSRTTIALDARVRRPYDANASTVRPSRVFVIPDSESRDGRVPAEWPGDIPSAQPYCFTSDVRRAASTGATPWPRDRMAADRTEGRYLASAECDGHWFGVSKIILTLLTCQGIDALVTNIPSPAVAALRLVCPELVTIASQKVDSRPLGIEMRPEPD